MGSPTSPFEILRGDLADLLYQATRQDRNIDYRFGTTITEVVENSEEKVRVKLSNNKEEEYDLLVAADGQWSPIRKAVFPADAVQVINKGCYCVYATVPRTKADSDYWDIHQALALFILALTTMERFDSLLLPCPPPPLRSRLGIVPLAATIARPKWT